MNKEEALKRNDLEEKMVKDEVKKCVLTTLEIRG
jgi:hypothetical protein